MEQRSSAVQCSAAMDAPVDRALNPSLLFSALLSLSFPSVQSSCRTRRRTTRIRSKDTGISSNNRNSMHHSNSSTTRRPDTVRRRRPRTRPTAAASHRPRSRSISRNHPLQPSLRSLNHSLSKLPVSPTSALASP